jgi:GDPmannose 4,6-dehydratase
MLQQEEPVDFVIATGKQYSVRDFISWSAKSLGITIQFSGSGVNEIGTVINIEGDMAPSLKKGQVIVKVDERYFRPSEVETLLGDASKAKKLLGWEPTISAQEMCKEMVDNDYQAALQYKLLNENGFDQYLTSED